MHLLPLISCICITQERVPFLKRAIKCFEQQTYPNRELIIVSLFSDLHTAAYLNSFSDTRIRFFQVGNQSLGALRNYGIAQAAGEYICQWDDDDWYHTERIEFQYNWMMDKRAAGSILSRCILLNSHSSEACVSGVRPWEGSLLCRKTLLREHPYEDLHKGEDTATVMQLFHTRQISAIRHRPELYVYVFHGFNTHSHYHHNSFFKAGTPLAEEHSQQISDIISNGISITKEMTVFNHYYKP